MDTLCGYGGRLTKREIRYEMDSSIVCLRIDVKPIDRYGIGIRSPRLDKHDSCLIVCIGGS